MKLWAPACLSLPALLSLSLTALAGDFDARGNYLPDPEAVAGHAFGLEFDWENVRYLPPGTALQCSAPQYQQAESASSLDGDGWVLKINTDILQGCAERFLVDVPLVRASYRATVWVRHGGVDAQMTVSFAEDDPRDTVTAKMSPTGRVTSDGWVELASNAFPIDAVNAVAVYLRVYDFDSNGSEVDALELVPVGDYVEERACSGVGDPICGDEQVCVHQQCRIGGLHVPVLPDPGIRDDVVDSMQTQLRVHYGGRKTRLEDLPLALDQLEAIRDAETAWAFWNGWAKSIRLLQDWHTRARGTMGSIERRKTMDACFIQGEADVSAAAWPPHPQFPDIMVSHVGVTVDHQHGLMPGDRLVAVDGKHPIEWSLDLIDEDWGYWQADDNAVYTEFAERMRGNILRYATHYDVIHCNGFQGTCDDTPTRYVVAELPDGVEDAVGCDNRPQYHFSTASNPPLDHRLGWPGVYQGRVRDVPPEDAIYGLVWDSLWGGFGSPIIPEIENAFEFFRSNARGVILDHRAGNGGTLNGAESATELARPEEVVLVFSSPIALGGWDGPATAEEGVALFNSLLNVPGVAMTAGSSSYDPDMPIALLTHRDGSASDFFPYAMKGIGPKVRIFGPAPTAGAFSTFYELQYWGGLSWSLASGDSIGADGASLIGNGVVPDVIVQQKQSDLMAGRDTIHEAALAWVQTELKPAP